MKKTEIYKLKDNTTVKKDEYTSIHNEFIMLYTELFLC